MLLLAKKQYGEPLNKNYSNAESRDATINAWCVCSNETSLMMMKCKGF